MPVQRKIEEWQQRVIDELHELNARRVRLNDFITGSRVYLGLPEDERERLRQQHAAMLAYERILGQRIANFTYPEVSA